MFKLMRSSSEARICHKAMSGAEPAGASRSASSAPAGRRTTRGPAIWLLAVAASLCLVTTVSAQPPAPDAKTAQIIANLGKVRVEDVRKNAPRGTLSPVRPNAGSRLETLQVETRYAPADGKTAYYFNRRGVLVSMAAVAITPLTKEELLRNVRGLEFKKYPPKETYVAFIRRSPNVIQGFYLSPDGKKVVLTTYDYVGR